MFKFIFAILTLFSTTVSASQRDELIQTFIGSSNGPAGKLDELFGYDVKLVNHYLFWEDRYGSQSLNIEHLIAYFNFYGQKFRQENCTNPFNPGFTGDVKDVVPLDTIRNIEFKLKHPSILYPTLNIKPERKADLAVYELCQFSKFAFLSLPFDPASIGGLNRNFKAPKGKIENSCKGISQQIIKHVLERNSVFSDHLKDTNLCNK